MCEVCGDNRLIVLFESLGRALVGLSECLGNEGRPLLLGGASGEFLVKLVLGNADPVQSVGKSTRYRSDLCRLVCGLYERVNRERVAKRTRNARGYVGPCSNVLFGGRELC